MIDSKVFNDLMVEAVQLKEKLEEFRSATYFMESFESTSGRGYMFIAYFDIDSMDFNFALNTSELSPVLKLDSIPYDTVIAYGEFIKTFTDYKNGSPLAKDSVKSNTVALDQTESELSSHIVEDEDYEL